MSDQQKSGVCWLVSFGLGSWGYFYPVPYRLCLFVLMAIPWLGLLGVILTRRDRDWLLGVLPIFPGLALCYRAFHEYQLLNWGRAVLLSLGLAALFVGLAWLADKVMRAQWGWLLVLFPYLAVTYGFGTSVAANALLDSSTPQHFTAPFIRRDRYYYTHSAHYTVTVGPWGDQTKPEEHRVTWEVYHALKDQKWACISMGTGRLGIRWYTLGACR